MVTATVNGVAVDGQAIELKYEVTKGAKAHHAQVYLDGQYQKGFKGPFTNRPVGTHEINLVAATDNLKTVAAEASAKMEVK